MHYFPFLLASLFLSYVTPLQYPSSFTSISREFSDVPMTITAGSIPSWLKGDFIRNGPGKFEVGGRRMKHLFDGYACLVKVNFGSTSSPLVSARFVETDAFVAGEKWQELTKRQRVLCSSSRLSQRSGLFTDAGFGLWFGLKVVTLLLASSSHFARHIARCNNTKSLWLPLHSFHL